jgi:hypothetical protein
MFRENGTKLYITAQHKNTETYADYAGFDNPDRRIDGLKKFGLLIYSARFNVLTA